jgi:hypothetical protein
MLDDVWFESDERKFLKVELENKGKDGCCGLFHGIITPFA